MIIKRVKLNNIRSYINQEIKFTVGSSLLAGNVGSGKSSILLAIDFALFGLQKGNITGSSLLRNDANSGYVELEFDLDDKNIIIRRGLKREGDKIIQDTGFIAINNEKLNLTATEIKQKVLELLNYPKELLTKSKSLIFRYTVYTPQEEMKQILLAEKDDRLDILRKIFGIDKYKRVKENSKIFVASLKERKKEFLGYIQDLDEKEKSKLEIENKTKELESGISRIIPKLNEINAELVIKKDEIKDTEESIKKLNLLKQEFIANDSYINNNIKIKNNYLKDIDSIKKELFEFKERNIDINAIQNRIKEKESSIKKIENEIKNLSVKLSELRVNKRNSESLKKSVLELDTCPTCKQDVTKDHKHNIQLEEDIKLEVYNKGLEVLEKNLEEKEAEFINLKKDRDYLKKDEQEHEIYLIKLENIKQKKKKYDLLTDEINSLNKELEKLENNKIKLNSNINNYKDIDNEYEKIKNYVDNILKEQKNIEIEKISLEK